MDYTPYRGHYRLFNNLVVEVKDIPAGLGVAFPGVPAGYEVILEPLDAPHTFRMRGGIFHGAPVAFVLPAEAGPATAVKVAHFELSRGAAWQEGDTVYLLPPPYDSDPDKEAAFARLWAAIQENGAGAEIEYALPYPRHEFLMYLTGRDALIFHGSNNQEIDEFVPLRQSFELRDPTGRGNLPAVYGTHDALWAMWFAILDKSRMKGSTQNGVMDFHNPAGETLSVYLFSISAEAVPLRPFKEGMLYFLPRDTFRQLEMAGGVPANEWASAEPVVPLAKLRIRPADFPFLDQVAGHSDPELARLSAATDAVLAAVTGHTTGEGQLTLTLDWQAESATGILDYISMMRVISPTAVLDLHVPAGAEPVGRTTGSSGEGGPWTEGGLAINRAPTPP